MTALKHSQRSSLYRVDPLRVEDGIPVFSAADRYTENYTQIAKDHIDRMSEDSANPWIPDELWQELEASTRALVRKYSRPGQKILDVGVSLARVIEQCPELDRYGIDISMSYLKIAQSKGIDVAYAKLEDMPYQDGVFDMVMATDVLEHVLDLHAATTQMLRVLKPGGHLIIRVPYREDLEVYLRTDLPYEFIHLRNFDEHSLRLHFQKIFRCEVLEINPVAPFLQGAQRLRYRHFSKADPIHAWFKRERFNLLRKDPIAYLVIEYLRALREEWLVGWLYRLQRKKPDSFAAIKPHLLMGIEMNVVVRKPE